jgi:hypothetical protein
VYEATTREERAGVVDMMAKKANRVDTAAPRDQQTLRNRIEHARTLPIAAAPGGRPAAPPISVAR